MGERLVCEWMCGIGGRVFSNRNHNDIELPVSMEIEHRDNEASRLTLTVWDGMTDEPFPIYNNTPDPFSETDVPVVAYARWDRDAWVKMFVGLLVAKKAKYPAASQTTFVALHKSYRLRKRGKVDTRDNISVKDMAKIKLAEEGLLLVIHQSALANEYLNTPAECLMQTGQSSWAFVDHHFRECGCVTNSVHDNEVVVRQDKSDGQVIDLARGDDKLISFDLRAEQKRENQSSRRKGHAHEYKSGRHMHHEDGDDAGKNRHVRTVPAAAPKKADGQRRGFYTKASVIQTARRLERQGKELTITFRAELTMNNQEVIRLSGFGPQISGDWETASVVHRFGNSAARTEAACIRGQ